MENKIKSKQINKKQINKKNRKDKNMNRKKIKHKIQLKIKMLNQQHNIIRFGV